MPSEYRRTTILAILSLILYGDDVSAQPRIVGGNPAAKGQFPFFVDVGGCGATLIAPGIVLTAAHCSDHDNYINRVVSVGAYQHGGSSTGATRSKVTDVLLHPQYDSVNINYDFALFRLEDDVRLPESSNVVLKMNKEDAFPTVGQPLTVIGLGVRSETDDSIPAILQQVEIEAIDYKTCNQQYEGQVQQLSMFCAGVDGGGKDSCQGDSGGPLFIRNGTEHIQVGIVSWGQGCARNGFPGVYARISHAYDWIRQIACGCWNTSSTEPLCEGYVDQGEDCPTAPPVFAPNPNCNDLPGYTDEFNDSCGWYEINDDPGCSVYGDISGGIGFEGIKPLDACCFCGGGGERAPTISASPTEAPLPTPGPTAFEIDPNCTDYEGFEDAYGDGCDWYAEFDDPGCPVEGETLGGDGFEDVSASDACCICGGGGERSPTPPPGPTTAPTPEVTLRGPDCQDFPGWKDSYKDGCDWYKDHDSAGCPMHGEEDGGPGFMGMSANIACCYCGGGTEDGRVQTKPPTPTPTVFSINRQCEDVPGFQDFCGDGCSWYEAEDSPGCPEWGDLVGIAASSEMEARDACCYCGGGETPLFFGGTEETTPEPTPEPTLAPEPTDTPTSFVSDQGCLDVEGFRDLFGDTCHWYEIYDDPGCPLWGTHEGGDGFENHTASTACCYCGRGSIRDGPLGNETMPGGDVGTEIPIISTPTDEPNGDDQTAASTDADDSSATRMECLLLLPFILVLASTSF